MIKIWFQHKLMKEISVKKIVITIDLRRIKVRKKAVPATKIVQVKTKKVKKPKLRDLLEEV